MSKGSESIPLDINLDQIFKYIRRKFSEIEAMFSFTLDVAQGSEKSILGYSKMWGWSRNRVNRFIQGIKNTSGFNKDTKRTLKGHPIFFIDKTLDSKQDTKRTLKGHPICKSTTPKKPKSKSFVPPKCKEVEDYFIENGYTKESGAMAWNYYKEGNWKDANGKQVLSWKQKMRGVWFKDQNKVQGQLSKKDKEAQMVNFRRIPTKNLREMAAGGNVHAFEVLRERKEAI